MIIIRPIVTLWRGGDGRYGFSLPWQPARGSFAVTSGPAYDLKHELRRRWFR